VPFDRASFARGFRDAVPVMLGVAPFGVLIGVTAVSIGIGALDTIAMSAAVFGGASQIAALALLESGAAPWVVLLSTAMVNLRHVLYSASLAPLLSRHGVAGRAAVSFVLVDHVYAFAIATFGRAGEPASRRDYLLGLGGTLWAMWVAMTAVGAIVGAQVPAAWQLDFAIPLIFLALMAPVLRSRPALAAAITGGSLAVALQTLPYNAGLVLAALAGISVGLMTESRWRGA
jgi:4-azaleucine resistance transporter AzlC